MNTPHPDRIAKGLWWDRAYRLTAGCTKLSPACDHCWAEREATDRQKHPNPKVADQYRGTFDGSNVRFLHKNVKKPLTVKKPTVWSVWNDLLHEKFALGSGAWVQVFEVMKQTPHHTYIICTKRAYRIPELIDTYSKFFPDLKDLPNVIIMTTTEDQQYYDLRGPFLEEVTLKTKWKTALALEPMLGPIHLAEPVDWVVCGGESGKQSRPTHVDWVQDIRDQCRALAIPFFFKQWGDWLPARQTHADQAYHAQAIYHWADHTNSHWIGKKLAGRLLDAQTHSEFPK